MGKSLFRHMAILRRFATTGKVERPEGVKKKAEFLYINYIVDLTETHTIPVLLVLKVDQSPLKYVPCGITTLAQKLSSAVPIKGVSDKRMITGVFTISLDGQCLPMQLIYTEKTDKVSQKWIFQKNFHRAPIQNTLVTKNSFRSYYKISSLCTCERKENDSGWIFVT